jgi:hypothetical protein
MMNIAEIQEENTAGLHHHVCVERRRTRASAVIEKTRQLTRKLRGMERVVVLPSTKSPRRVMRINNRTRPTKGTPDAIPTRAINEVV